MPQRGLIAGMLFVQAKANGIEDTTGGNTDDDAKDC